MAQYYWSTWSLLSFRSVLLQLHSKHLSISSRSRVEVRPFCSASVWLHLEYWFQFWAPLRKRDVDIQDRRVVKGLEHLSCEERPGGLGLFSLKRRRLKGMSSVTINT